MATAVLVVGALVLAVALAGLARPGRVVARAVEWQGPGLVAFGAGVRIGVAVLLWLAADASRHPTALRVLAGVSAVAALAVLAMGPRGLARLVGWWAAQPASLQRVGFGLAAAFGAFLVYAVA